jgi:sRNA-binding regulator protein Hfq
MRSGFGDRNDSRGSSGRGSQAPPSSDPQRRKPTPPEKTHAEEYYFVKQMNAKTPMVITLDGGEELRGWIEWYDEECIKVNRADAPNLLLFKRAIRYMCKDPEAGPGE